MEGFVKTILQQALKYKVTFDSAEANQQHYAKTHSKHLGKVVLSKPTFLCDI
jgi:hypothetical protein